MTLCVRRPLFCALALAALACPACDDFDSPDPASLEPRGGPGEYPPLNTSKLLNTEVAAVDTTGLELEGVKLVSVQVQRPAGLTPIRMHTLRANAGKLVAEVGAASVSGEEFLGSVWSFEVDTGLSTVTVDAQMTAVETAMGAGLYLPGLLSDRRKLDPARLVYTLQYENDDDEMIDVCEADTTFGAKMLIFGDITVDPDTGDISERPNTLHFGCLTSAVGKAAKWGYAPDSPTLTSIGLDEFETGVRMVRADYCGDGDSHTKVGNFVSIRDRWGINDEFFNGFTTEAAWKAGGGATCLQRIRASGKTLVAPFVCSATHVIPLCGTEAEQTDRLLTGLDDIWTKIPPL